MTDLMIDSDDLMVAVSPLQNGEPTATVRVAWRISDRLLGDLRRAEARNPSLLIVVTDRDNTRFQQARLVPLADGYALIGLRHAGSNTIHATVVWRPSGRPLRSTHFTSPSQIVRDLNEERQDALGWEFDEIDRQISYPSAESDIDELKARLKEIAQQIKALNNESIKLHINPRLDKLRQLCVQVAVDVAVSEGLFAKEPSAAKKWLARFATGRRRFVDQCQMREFAIYGCLKLLGLALASPIWVAWKLVGVFVILAMLLAGVRGIGYREWFSWRYGFLSDIWRHAGLSIWWWRKATPEEAGPYGPNYHVRRGTWSIFINPLAFVLIAFLLWLTFGVHNGLLHAAMLCILGYAILFWIVYGGIRFRQRRRNADWTDQKQDRRKLDEDLAPIMGSPAFETGVVMEELKPAGRRTLRLLFWETKARACKPFSQ